MLHTMDKALPVLLLVVTFVFREFSAEDTAIVSYVNDTLRLHCPRSVDDGLVTSISWLVKTNPIASIRRRKKVYTKIQDRYVDHANISWAELTLRRLRLSDEAKYECRLEVDRLLSPSHFFTVVVNVRPEGVSLTGLRRPLLEDDELRATCSVGMVKPVAGLYWRRGGGEPEEGRVEVTSHANGTSALRATYTRRVTHRDDDTLLHCLVTQLGDSSTVLAERRQRIYVYHKPHGAAYIDPASPRVRLGEGGAELTCMPPGVAGRPHPLWALWERRWDPQWGLNATRPYFFQPADVDSSNQFRCCVGNEYGYSDWSAWVVVPIVDPADMSLVAGADVNVPMVVGIVIGCAVFLCVVVVILLLMVRRRKAAALREKARDGVVDKDYRYPSTEPDVIHDADDSVPLQNQQQPMSVGGKPAAQNTHKTDAFPEIPFADVPLMRPVQRFPEAPRSDTNENLYANVPPKPRRSASPAQDRPPTPPEPLMPSDGLTYAQLEFRPQQYRKPAESGAKPASTIYSDVKFNRDKHGHEV